MTIKANAGTHAYRLVTPTGAFRAWFTVMITIIGFGVAIGLTIFYVTKVDRAAEQRNIERSREICTIIVLIDDRNQKFLADPSGLPAATRDETLSFARAVHDFRERIGCDQKSR